MPIITGSGSLLMSITMGHRPLMAVAGVMIMIASVIVGIVMFVAQHNGPRKRIREQRERYVDYLDQLREIVRNVASSQRSDNAFRYPSPGLLTEIARSRARRWERRAHDADFLTLRCGHGTRPLARPLRLKVNTSDPLIVYDPVCQGAAEQLIDLYAHVPEMPLLLPVRDHGVISIVGDRTAARGMARSLVAQMAAFHSPHDLRVGVVRDHRLRTQWEWLKWLPHNMFEGAKDGPMPARLVSGNTVQMAELLEEEVESRTVDLQRRRGARPGPGTQRLVVILEGEYQSTLSGLAAEPPVTSLADLGIHVIALVSDRREEPEAVDLRLSIDSDGTVAEERKQEGTDQEDQLPARLKGTADRCSVAHMNSLARLLAPFGMGAADGDDAMHATVGLPEILGVHDVAELDTSHAWKSRSGGDYLRVPIGLGPNGNTVLLDLKESAFGGMGPHGLVVGATGSGKSEMLRTLLASLVINHSPENLALLLVDFKGGATFADTDRLPHSAGLITNLADDDALVLRFREASYGELLRRQQILKDMGNLPNLHAYEEARAKNPELEPLPHLLIIIDEFSELLTAHPDFAELFVAIGRIGRSIGVHLLLSTQRLEAGKLKGLESHLSYRIGLRTFSEAESREAIGVGDAYHLPPEPGSGYLKVDTSVFERFKAAMVSQPYEPPADESEEEDEVPVLPLLSFNGLDKALRTGKLVDSLARVLDKDEEQDTEDRTTLQVTVDRIVASGAEPVRPIWLPPLPDVLSFDEVLDELGESGDMEGEGTEPHHSEIRAMIGLTDLPRDQRVEPTELDFSGGEGNMIVLGGPQSGKSNLLRAMITSLAWRYPPRRVAVYAIDFGGGSLQAMEDLPHVAGVAGRADPERVQRVLVDVQAQLDRRQRLFRQHRLDTPAALRRARAQGTIPSGIVGDIFLLIDSWSSVRESFDEADELLMDIATRGPALGVHTVLTGASNTQLRARLQSLFGGRLELRLSDSMDSGIGRKIADQIPKDRPGRGIRSDELHLHVALPRVDGRASTEDLGEGLQDLVERVKNRWPQQAVQGVKTLPERVKLEEVVEGKVPTRRRHKLVLGLGESSLRPVSYNLDKDPHLTVYGDPKSGKSTLLRGLVNQIIQRPVEEVGIIMVDFRRSHLELVPEEYLLAYCTNADRAKAVAENLADSLKERLPGPDVTPQQLRERSWWTGLDIYVVADDVDMLGSRGSPLSSLAPYIQQGSDLGIHLITARRTGGAGRALLEPITQAMSDMGAPAMLFSGDRREGRLANGTASKQLPQGRAQLALRGKRPELVQVGWSESPL